MHTRSRPTAELPDLTPGVTLVDVDANLGVTPIQALLLDQALGGDGDVYWVDGTGEARTTRLRELAPPRILERVHIARGFTAEQHTSLIDRLGGALDERETLVYHTGDGWMQTTLAYWREVLEHRARMHDGSTLERAAGAVGAQ